MKKILALALASLMLVSFAACSKKDEDNLGNNNDDEILVSADELVYGNLTYGINSENGLFEITGLVRTNTDLVDIVVPPEIEGRDVVGIADKAFHNTGAYIKSITLPETITYIGDHAFFGCKYITSITLPKNVTEIGFGAFEGCSALETVTFSENLVTIGNGAFKDCVALKNLTIPAKVESIGYAAFWNCDAITEIAIPQSVKSIDDGAFYDCDALAKATVTDKVTDIGEIVFNSCADGFTLTAPADSAFAAYGDKNGYNVVAPAPVEPAA
jgi:hypothetical protein